MAFARWQLGKWSSLHNEHDRILSRGADDEAMPRPARDVPLLPSEPRDVLRKDLVIVHTKGHGAGVSARWYVQSGAKLIDQEDRIECAVPHVQLNVDRDVPFERAAPGRDEGKEKQDGPHAGESTRA